MPTENRSNDADGWIACDDGLHLIQMNKNLSHYGWVFRKINGGLPYSVREATAHEMAHALARQHLRIGVAQIAGKAPADPGEVERLHAELASANADKEAYAKNAIDLQRRVQNADLALAAQTKQVHTLRAQLAERGARLQKRGTLLGLARRALLGWAKSGPVIDQIDDDLSASAEPSAPKCETCKGNGVVGWTRGQTAESFEQGESPCEDCNATGYAHSNGMPVSGACTTCNGTGMVDDGEITCSEGGIPYENGPVKCVKECPDCTPSAPVKRDERDERAEFEALHDKTWPRSEFLHLSHHEYGKKLRWEGWQARAALERKP